MNHQFFWHGIEDPTVLQGDSNSSTFKAEVNDNSLRAKSAIIPGSLFNSPETAIDLTTPAAPFSSSRWHDIDDFSEIAPHLHFTEQGTLTSNSIRPHTLSSHLSSKSLHDNISTEGSHCTRSEAMTSSLSLSLHHFRASPENQLNQEGHLHTNQGIVDKHGLVDLVLNTFPMDKGWGSSKR
jgi:hypothetical protein